ncbi:MAG: 1-deoxy-D-xylulose-5-phosphate reductoisomerase [Pseudomonadota bacterium]|nr:1-deoxy-D-xylulose-5-phosphate reductoisomerase [Pseudomonadota bacterium]
MTQRLVVLGSTGSIGVSTLEVAALHPQRYRVFALTAHTNHADLYTQCLRHQPRFAALADPAAAAVLARRLAQAGSPVKVLAGPGALCEVAKAPEVDVVMAAIVGAAGLLPTLAAVQAGKKVLLANKESLVMGGELFMAAVEQSGAQLLPIDSEHNAIFQCLPPLAPGGSTAACTAEVRKILLTASGGPFRQRDPRTLDSVTPEEACAHPNWRMGPKISVDSATMMNKGLELIEACHLFQVEPECVEILVHPESVVHSLVEYVDGSVLAQLGNPDMRTPIAHALAWPERIESGVARLRLDQIGALHFEPPQWASYPCLSLAIEAAKVGGTAGAVLNAANEVAVEAFLSGGLAFTQIPHVLTRVLARLPPQPVHSLEQVLGADQAARELARRIVEAAPIAAKARPAARPFGGAS